MPGSNDIKSANGTNLMPSHQDLASSGTLDREHTKLPESSSQEHASSSKEQGSQLRLDIGKIRNLHYFKVLGLNKDSSITETLKSLVELESTEYQLSADIVDARLKLKKSEENVKAALSRVKKREIISRLEKALTKFTGTDKDSRAKKEKTQARLDSLKESLKEEVTSKHLPSVLDTELSSIELYQFTLSAIAGAEGNESSGNPKCSKREWTQGALSPTSLSTELQLHSMSTRLCQSELETLLMEHTRLEEKKKQLNDNICSGVRSAQKRLSIRMHPDKIKNSQLGPNGEEMNAYQEVLAAYQVLANTEYRNAYVKIANHQQWLSSDKKKELDRRAGVDLDKKDALREKLSAAIANVEGSKLKSPSFTITKPSSSFLKGGRPHRCTIPSITSTPGSKKGLTRLRITWTCARVEEFRVSHYIVEAALISLDTQSAITAPKFSPLIASNSIVKLYPTSTEFVIIYCAKDPYFLTEHFPPGAYVFRVRAFNSIGPGPYSMTQSHVIADYEGGELFLIKRANQISKVLQKRVEARNELEQTFNALQDVVGKVNKNVPLTEKVVILTDVVEQAQKNKVELLDPWLMDMAKRELSEMQVAKESRDALGIWREKLRMLVKATLGQVDKDDTSDEVDSLVEGLERQIGNADGDGSDEKLTIVEIETTRVELAELARCRFARFISSISTTALNPTIKNMIQQSCLKTIEQCSGLNIRLEVPIDIALNERDWDFQKLFLISSDDSNQYQQQVQSFIHEEYLDPLRNTAAWRCWLLVQAVRKRRGDLFSKAWSKKLEEAWATVVKSLFIKIEVISEIKQINKPESSSTGQANKEKSPQKNASPLLHTPLPESSIESSLPSTQQQSPSPASSTSSSSSAFLNIPASTSKKIIPEICDHDKLCNDYTFGPKCSYFRSSSNTKGKPNTILFASSADHQQQRKLPPRIAPIIKEKEICQFYMSKGYCRFGNACWYAHVDGKRASIPMGSHLEANEMKPSKITRSPLEDQKKIKSKLPIVNESPSLTAKVDESPTASDTQHDKVKSDDTQSLPIQARSAYSTATTSINENNPERVCQRIHDLTITNIDGGSTASTVEITNLPSDEAKSWSHAQNIANFTQDTNKTISLPASNLVPLNLTYLPPVQPPQMEYGQQQLPKVSIYPPLQLSLPSPLTDIPNHLSSNMNLTYAQQWPLISSHQASLTPYGIISANCLDYQQPLQPNHLNNEIYSFSPFSPHIQPQSPWSQSSPTYFPHTDGHTNWSASSNVLFSAFTPVFDAGSSVSISQHHQHDPYVDVDVHSPTQQQQHSGSITPTSNPLANLLSYLQLSKYVQLFESHEIDFHALCLMNADHLESLGIPFGPRLKIMSAVQILNSQNNIGQEVRNGQSHIIPNSGANDISISMMSGGGYGGNWEGYSTSSNRFIAPAMTNPSAFGNGLFSSPMPYRSEQQSLHASTFNERKRNGFL